MPCRDNSYYDDLEMARKILDAHTALLCAAFTVLEADGTLASVMSRMSREQSGMSPQQVRSWWKTHKREDEKRRLREKKDAAEKRERDRALAKLSPRERRLLNVEEES